MTASNESFRTNCIEGAIAALAVCVAAAGAGCAARSGPIARTGAGEDRLSASPPSREAERAACAEVPDRDRDLGPFAHRERIVGLQILHDRPYPKEMPQVTGVAVYLRASAGVSEEWMGRVLQCHLIHHAAAGDGATDRSSPLFVDDARVSLSSTGDGFRIAITSADVSAAREIVERARGLVE